MTDQKNFHIFGHGISFSISPIIHAAGFNHYGLLHTYDIQQTESVTGILNFINSESFGGASVTMPHKLAVQQYCDEQTETARKIGAVNTLIVRDADSFGKRTIVGDNTDWSGLFAIIQKYSKCAKQEPRFGLIIGAGGASRAALYAMHQAGLKDVYLVNRTAAKAQEVVDDFRDIMEVRLVSSLQSLPRMPDIIIGTIPADKTTETDFQNCFGETGLCIDMSYKPRQTPLLTVAQSHAGWTTITGVEVLLHQAFDQFELWIGKPAPREVMTEAALCRDRKSGI